LQAHSAEEVEDFVAIASALLINIGTVTSNWTVGMKLAAAAATRLGKPWVLDPVGCGATPYRTQVCQEMAGLQPWVIRGNASEILALAGAAAGPTRGVDSNAAATDALDAAAALAISKNCVVAVSGAVDLVTDGKSVIEVDNGVAMLQDITATGCSVTAVIAAFCACMPRERAMEAAAFGLAVFGVAAELAAAGAGAAGPGSLRVALLDTLLHGLSAADVTGEGKDASATRVRLTRRDLPTQKH
jgi:hydroxyethylthiazole kinase